MCQNTFSDSGSEEESRGNQVNPQYTITPGGSHEESAAVVMPESHSLSQRVEKHRQQLSRITFVAPPYSNESELDPASSSVNILGPGVHTMAFRFAPAESTATAMARASEAYLQRIQENRWRLSRMTFSVSSPKFDESENGAASASPVNVPDRSQRPRASQFRDTWFPSPEQTPASPVNDPQPSDQPPAFRFQKPLSLFPEPVRIRFIDNAQDCKHHTFFNFINRIPDHSRYPHAYYGGFWSCVRFPNIHVPAKRSPG